MKIDGQVAVVTGAGSGLGEATARHLASIGARVGLLDLDIDRARAVASEIDGHAVQLDVSSETAVESAFEEIDVALGSARIAVNCAGVAPGARIVGREGKTSCEVFRRTMEINLFGTYYVMTHAAKRMMNCDPMNHDERGVIVNTASIAWEDGQLGQSAYAASKGAIASMCLPAAREFSRSGIRVMTIAPGLFSTPLMEGLPEDVVAGITANIPFPARLGDPIEYALLVEQIVANPFLNGTTVRLDGAMRLPPR